MAQALAVQTAGNDFWIDHREPIGLDDWLAGSLADGVQIHAEANSAQPTAEVRYRGYNVGLRVAPHGGRTTVRFRWLDRSRPSRPALAAGPHSSLGWERSQDTGSVVARYEVRLRGVVVARVADDFRFEPGAEVRGHGLVTVVAVDRAGNRSLAAVRRC